ncbi:MAG: response regulator transcription factor [Anaerolineae bacterium]|jgi:two-component system nitrate/nitrite response regulator NarL|nr:response regulator transcription factor [Anaerolineae bacterium]
MSLGPRVLIVDDSPTVREDLRTLLSLLESVEVVGEASGAAGAIPTAIEVEPDVIIIDLEMGGSASAELDGLQAIGELKRVRPSASVYVLTVHGYPAARQAALHAGADLFFTKGQDTDGLLRAIRAGRVSGSSI